MGLHKSSALRGSAFARGLFIIIVGVFAVSVLVQIFLAGDAALLAPEMWQAHMEWVHIFQWLAVVLPIAAYFSARRLSFTLSNCLPILIIGLQYSLVHIGINRSAPIFVGLHAALGAVLFGFLIFIAQEWRYSGFRTAPSA